MSEPAAASAADPRAGFEERLRGLEAVTDVSLSRLSVEDLLPELLDRVRDLLGADTAAVLLMDDSEQFLVATAARGLEEEVRQGSRVPLGRGFAGRVAAERRPVVVDDVTPRSVVNPVLLYKGVRSMLGVPLLDGDQVLGVLHVGMLQTRVFTANDIGLLGQVADRAARAIAAVRVRADASAALALQRSLAPTRMPSVAGYDLAARYVPGSRSGVGGDWYDVFVLPHGAVGIAMGDVMGHGLRAATVMGRLRSELRAFALLSEDPAEVLGHLDRAVLQFEPGQMATVVYVVLDPGTGVARIASAGHPAPVVRRVGRSAVGVEVPQDLLLGVDDTSPRRTIEVQVRAGDLLCLFTDGLIERRDRDLSATREQLQAVLSADYDSAEATCAEVMASLIGDHPVDDDVALLVLRRTAPPLQ